MMINKKHMAFSCNDRIKMRVKHENLLLFSHKHTQKKKPKYNQTICQSTG